jgi:hypothetical protein
MTDPCEKPALKRTRSKGKRKTGRIYRDEKGLYIRSWHFSLGDTDHYRPGGVIGFNHAFEMGEAGLAEGDNPKAAHIPGAPLVRIRLEDGWILHWAIESAHRLRDLGPEP